MIEEQPEEPCDLTEAQINICVNIHDRIVEVMNGYVAEHDLLKIHGPVALNHIGFHALAMTVAAVFEPHYREEGPEHFQEMIQGLGAEAQAILEEENDDSERLSN